MAAALLRTIGVRPEWNGLFVSKPSQFYLKKGEKHICKG